MASCEQEFSLWIAKKPFGTLVFKVTELLANLVVTYGFEGMLFAAFRFGRFLQAAFECVAGFVLVCANAEVNCSMDDRSPSSARLILAIGVQDPIDPSF